jgi:hypothetical protein
MTRPRNRPFPGLPGLGIGLLPMLAVRLLLMCGMRMVFALEMLGLLLVALRRLGHDGSWLQGLRIRKG